MTVWDSVSRLRESHRLSHIFVLYGLNLSEWLLRLSFLFVSVIDWLNLWKGESGRLVAKAQIQCKIHECILTV